MKTVTLSNMAESIGVNTLTGEACAFAQRILCDVNENGRALVLEYLGLPGNTALHAAWNSRVGDDPAIGSIMLDRTALGPLMRFALMREGFPYVLGADDAQQYTGVAHADITPDSGLADVIHGRAAWSAHLRVFHNMRAAGGQPVEGSRNVHAFTGRAA